MPPVISRPEPSPLSPASLAGLLFQPRQFFSNLQWLKQSPEIVLVAWLAGIAYTMGRIDQNMVRAEFGRPRPGWAEFGPLLTDSWLNYWSFVLAWGALSGLVFWHLGVWWYRKRLGWCGIPDPGADLVRPLFFYQDLVLSGPTVLVAISQALRFPTYGAAWSALDYASLIVPLFTVWSCVVSYKAATTVFTLDKWRARLWFLVLPLLAYGLALGILGALYVRFGGG